MKNDMKENKKKEQININVHSEKAEFFKVIHEGLVNGGIYVTLLKDMERHAYFSAWHRA